MSIDRRAIRCGLTIEEGSYSAGILAGHDNSEHPIYLCLSYQDLCGIKDFIEDVQRRKEDADLFGTQLYCQHETVDGVCTNCGAKEEDYPSLLAEREARRHYY